MEFILWAIRALVILLLLRFVLRLLASTFASPAAPPRRRAGGGAAERAGGRLVRDPQCGTYVPQDRALTLGSGAGVQYFCSATCRDAWVRAHGA
jgi:YHS domain-containing protein